jgi:hypothetical protein
MSDSPKEEEKANVTLREDKINKLFNAFDDCMDVGVNDDKMNFLEIELAITMLSKKLSFEQIKSWISFMQEDEGYQPPENKPPGGMFG